MGRTPVSFLEVTILAGNDTVNSPGFSRELKWRLTGIFGSILSPYSACKQMATRTKMPSTTNLTDEPRDLVDSPHMIRVEVIRLQLLTDVTTMVICFADDNPVTGSRNICSENWLVTGFQFLLLVFKQASDDRRLWISVCHDSDTPSICMRKLSEVVRDPPLYIFGAPKAT